MKIFQSYLIIVLCAFSMLACSTTTGTHVKKSHYSRNYIYAEEINEDKGANAYDLIKNLRPQWLRPSGTNFISDPVVYVDGAREGDLYVLSTIARQHIAQLQFFNSAEAFIRFGPDNSAGAILVTTR